MRRIAISFVVGVALALALVGAAFAQEICTSGETYALNYVVPMLESGGLTNDGSVAPGTHSGFAGLCLGLGR
ncbi:MAG: hypothetical protein M3301_03625 [Chloroflexota bacterium]|nr:hypothetical protein [Chloroflexota bacterium]